MCTAADYKTADHYFGRSLDLEHSGKETITVTPRNYPFRFRKTADIPSHHAVIGTACIAENYPLYYDAVNETGLGIAALNFPGNADYKPEMPGKENIASFELIPWILCQCSSVPEAEHLLKHTNIINLSFNDTLPATPLHWMIADRNSAVTVEQTADGLNVYENPVHVLTNNPPFPLQMFSLNNCRGISPQSPKNSFSTRLTLETYSRGMGGIGLPGDFSSQSRFIKTAFTLLNSVSGTTDSESISQFFHILDTAAQPRGAVDLGNSQYEYTVYTSCCNTDTGVYYYKTYENSQVSAVDMHKEDLESSMLISYSMIHELQIKMQN